VVTGYGLSRGLNAGRGERFILSVVHIDRVLSPSAFYSLFPGTKAIGAWSLWG